MKRQIKLIVFLFILSTNLVFSTETIDWQLVLDNEVRSGFVETKDGHYVFSNIAVSSSVPSADIQLKKMGAGSGEIIWENIYGGSSFDGLKIINELYDHSIMVLGQTQSTDVNGYNEGYHAITGNRTNDIWVLKLDYLTGDTLWTLCIGNSLNEEVISYVQDGFGNIYILGTIDSANILSSPETKLLSAKIDGSTGKLIWLKTFGCDSLVVAKSIRELSETSILIVGSNIAGGQDAPDHYGEEDIWCIGLDKSNGGVIWNNVYGGPGSETLLDDYNSSTSFTQSVRTFDKNEWVSVQDDYVAITVLTDSLGDQVNNYHLGYLLGNRTTDIWTVFLDKTNGDTIKTVTVGSTRNEQVTDIVQVGSENGLFILGNVYGQGGNIIGYHENPGASEDFNVWPDFLVVKISKKDGLEWAKAVGGTNQDFPQFLNKTFSNQILVTGTTNSEDGDVQDFTPGESNLDFDFFAFQLDYSGNLVWNHALGGSGNEELWRTQEQCDGSFILSGDGYSFTPSGEVTEGLDSCPLGECEYLWSISIDTLGEVNWDKVVNSGGHDETGSVLSTKKGLLQVGYVVHSFVLGEKTIGGDGVWISKLGSTSDFEFTDGFCVNDTIHFFDVSEESGELVWSFGDGTILENQENPIHVYNEIGTFKIILYNTHSCITDTVLKEIQIVSKGCQEEGSIYFPEVVESLKLPSTFSPNGDGLNDIFDFSNKEQVKDVLEFFIYDRWGNEIFESTDVNVGWAGSDEVGQYFYTCRYKNFSGDIIDKVGTVLLLK